MTYQHKPNRGNAFKNKRKEKEGQPDLSGDALIDGKHYWVSAWKNKDKNGETYITLSFNSKDEAYAKAKETVQETNDLMDDTIPF